MAKILFLNVTHISQYTLYWELFSLVLQRFPEVVTGETDIDQIVLEKTGNRTASQAVVDSLAWKPLMWENLAPPINCWLCNWHKPVRQKAT